MNQLYYLLLFSCATLVGCSSPKIKSSSSIMAIETGGDWTGHRYMHYCPEYTFSETGTLSTPLDILGNNHISLAGPDCTEAISKAREHIDKYYGHSFLHKCSFYDIDIVYNDSIKAFERRGAKPDLEKCGEAKYFVRFLLNLRPDTSYRFGIAMDENFKMISKVEFPNFDEHKNDLSIIGPVEAHNIAIKKHPRLVKHAEEIILDYDEDLRRFVWEISSEDQRIRRSNVMKKGLVIIDAVNEQVRYAKRIKHRVMFNPRHF